MISNTAPGPAAVPGRALQAGGRDNALISVEGLSLSVGSGPGARPILSDLDLDIRRGEFLGIVGESGSGKSTLLFSILNYLSPGVNITGGRILYRDRDILGMRREELRALRGRSIGMVYQDPSTSLTPSMKVGAQITEVRAQHFGESAEAAKARVFALFDTVGLDDPERIYNAFPHELSGGQRQRIVIAMALAGEPDVLLLDEPTTALDVVIQSRLLETLRTLQRTMSLTAVIVSHDLGVVASVADRIGVLYAGELMEIGPTSAVLGKPANPYTRALLAAVPSFERTEPVHGLKGTVSRDDDRFRRCVFLERCDLRAEPCGTTRPPFAAAAGEDHLSRCHFPAARPAAPAKSAARAAVSMQRSDPVTLDVEDIVIDYARPGLFGKAGTQQKAVDGVSFGIRSGRVTALVGESGSGKSSIARAIVGLEACAAGRIRFGDKDIAALGPAGLRLYRQKVQMVFQNPSGSLNPSKTVGNLICRPMRLAGIDGRTAGGRARDLLEAVGLDAGFFDRNPRELSGGEKQRVAIARVFATAPSLVVLDEPTTALDVSVQAGVLDLLKQLQAETNCGYLLISHDLAVVRQLADDVIVMQAGRVRETGPIDEIFDRPEHPYTRMLVAAARQLKTGGGSGSPP